MSHSLSAQIDTISEVPKYHSPKKATLYSAVLPGAGQIYNKKWWKVPIVYLGLGTSVYFFNVNNFNFKGYKAAFIETEREDIRLLMEESRRWRDISAISFVAVYALQIIDANVDAHLFHFDVSDDLSINWAPQPILNGWSGKTSLGVGMRIQF